MCVMAAHKPDPDPETPEKATRRKFPTTYKLKVLAELDKAGPNQIGVIQRREGLYSGVLRVGMLRNRSGNQATEYPVHVITLRSPLHLRRRPCREQMSCPVLSK